MSTPLGQSQQRQPAASPAQFQQVPLGNHGFSSGAPSTYSNCNFPMQQSQSQMPMANPSPTAGWMGHPQPQPPQGGWSSFQPNASVQFSDNAAAMNGQWTAMNTQAASNQALLPGAHAGSSGMLFSSGQQQQAAHLSNGFSGQQAGMPQLPTSMQLWQLPQPQQARQQQQQQQHPPQQPIPQPQWHRPQQMPQQPQPNLKRPQPQLLQFQQLQQMAVLMQQQQQQQQPQCAPQHAWPTAVPMQMQGAPGHAPPQQAWTAPSVQMPGAQVLTNPMQPCGLPTASSGWANSAAGHAQFPQPTGTAGCAHPMVSTSSDGSSNTVAASKSRRGRSSIDGNEWRGDGRRRSVDAKDTSEWTVERRRRSIHEETNPNIREMLEAEIAPNPAPTPKSMQEVMAHSQLMHSTPATAQHTDHRRRVTEGDAGLDHHTWANDGVDIPAAMQRWTVSGDEHVQAVYKKASRETVQMQGLLLLGKLEGRSVQQQLEQSSSLFAPETKILDKDQTPGPSRPHNQTGHMGLDQALYAIHESERRPN